MLSLIKNLLNEILLFLLDIFTRWLGGKKQFLPTLEDIRSKEVKELVGKLRGKSEKDTLVNILEWQSKNILFWTDRMYSFPIMYILLVLSACLLPMNTNVRGLLIIIFIILSLINISIVLSYLLPLISMIILLFSWAYLINPLQAQKALSVIQLVALSMVFGALIILIFYLLLKYQNIKSQIPGFKLIDTFKLSLSVDKILRYKIAVCKDYAKLTASLLFNIYPYSEIYFLTIPRHVATAIKVNGSLYVLDQRLPILTINRWLKVWNQKSANVYVSKLKRNPKGETSIDFRKYKKELLLNFSEKSINIEKLTREVTRLLKIDQKSQKRKHDFEIILPDFATYYEDDEIVIHSMARAIKNKLESEFCGNINRISKIDIIQNERNLIVKIYINNL